MPPSEPDWVARSIAVLGLLVALASLVLTWRRDRAFGRVGVRISYRFDPVGVRSHDLSFGVVLSNVERRQVTVQSAGFAARRWFSRRRPFKGFLNHRVETGGFEPPFHGGGLVLEPNGPAKQLVAIAFRVRGYSYPDVVHWFWCEDTDGNVYWKRLPPEATNMIASVLPRKIPPEPDPRGGETVSTEIEPGDDLSSVEFDVETPWY